MHSEALGEEMITSSRSFIVLSHAFDTLQFVLLYKKLKQK